MSQKRKHNKNASSIRISANETRSTQIVSFTGNVVGSNIGGFSFQEQGGAVNYIASTHEGRTIDFGWIRLETPPNDTGIVGPVVSHFGQFDGWIDTRIVDFDFMSEILRAESIGGGRIRVSIRNEESAVNGLSLESILEPGEQISAGDSTLFNLLPTQD